MEKIVNLNKYRKQQIRERADRRASENRVRFGRDKGEVSRDRLLAKRAAKKLDDHRRD